MVKGSMRAMILDRRLLSMKVAVVLVVLALGLAAPSALAAATISSPTVAKVGSHITASASGLKPGHYTLELVVEVLPGGASPTNCVGRVGTATAVAGHVRITGKLPGRLACYQGVGEVGGSENTKPGNYRLSLGVSFAPNGFSGSGSFVTRKIRLTS
jgi:hypothetical protein